MARNRNKTRRHLVRSYHKECSYVRSYSLNTARGDSHQKLSTWWISLQGRGRTCIFDFGGNWLFKFADFQQRSSTFLSNVSCLPSQSWFLLVRYNYEWISYRFSRRCFDKNKMKQKKCVENKPRRNNKNTTFDLLACYKETTGGCLGSLYIRYIRLLRDSDPPDRLRMTVHVCSRSGLMAYTES